MLAGIFSSLTLFCGFFNCIPKQEEVKIHNELKLHNRRNTRLIPIDTSLPPLVYTHSGWVEGYFQKTINGRDIAAFEGIPYGKDTGGQRRFKKPEPFGSWHGIKKATTRAPQCLQIDVKKLMNPTGFENCLFLNIFTPSLEHSSNQKGLPVIFYIHGGGNIWWNGGDFGPVYMLKRDLILVTVNYRLGIFGFLSTGDNIASGNWALKDQLLALKWTRQNIKSFGGDPNRITITGLSTGSNLASLHIVSPQTKGLISGAILESGTAMDHYAIINKTVATSKEIARKSGCPTQSSQEMVDCLRKKDGNWLMSRNLSWRNLVLFKIEIGAVIEPTTAEEPFITKDPKQYYLQKEVAPIPVIFGVNKEEGGLFAAVLYMTTIMMAEVNRDFEKWISHIMEFDEGQVANPREVARRIKNFYLKGKPMSWGNKDAWINMFGDRAVYLGNYHAIQYHSRVGPAYGYFFSYLGTSFLKMLQLPGQDWGVVHGDVTTYLYNGTLQPAKQYGTPDYKISEMLTNLWANFAETGIPYYTDEVTGIRNKVWNRVKDPYNIKLFEINQHSQMINIPYKDRLDFWDSLNISNSLKFVES